MSELSAPSSVDLMQSLPMSTPADTSGDETSSRGTLDSFIPPPKDFEGKNNPFRNLSELLGAGGFNQSQSSSSSYNPSPITLPLPLTPVISQPPIVRPTKRQLSEKDIIIDRNGQVKRRRQHRRGRPPNQPQQNQQQQQFKVGPIDWAKKKLFDSNNRVNQLTFHSTQQLLAKQLPFSRPGQTKSRESTWETWEALSTGQLPAAPTVK